MADIKKTDSEQCRFNTKGGWSPRCEKQTDNGWCTDHENLICCSCGERATRSCDAGMGGLMCGAHLCDTCTHGQSGGHVTKDVADEEQRLATEERAAKVASRTSADRRMNDEINVPLNLFELLKGDWKNEGHTLTKVYSAHLEHGLMGYFPAVFAADTKRMVFMNDLSLMEKVWGKLEPQDAGLDEDFAYVNAEIGIGYLEARRSGEREEKKPFRLLQASEFERLAEANEETFQWAPGLLGGKSPDKESFLRSFADLAAKLDPSFRSAA